MGKQRSRWVGGSLVLVAGAIVASTATTGIPIVASNGATAETTTVQSGSPSISITPVDSLLQPLLDLLSQPPAPAPAEPAVPVPQDAPAPAAETAPPTPAQPAPAGLAGSVLDATNRDRAANGLAPLAWNGQLAGVAQSWANWMAQHGSLTHQDMNAILSRTGFATVGENILYGPVDFTAADMESAWMNSPPHRANILDPSFTAAGVGLAVGPDGLLWACVDFGG